MGATGAASKLRIPVMECVTSHAVTALLDQLGSALDPVERKRLSDEVQLHIMNQHQYFPLYWEQEATAWWPEVRGFAHSSPEATDSFRRFFHVWIDPDHKDDKSNRGQTSGPPGGL